MKPVPGPSEPEPRPPAPRLVLDPEQLAAASASSGPLLVVAGPGTGKTHTLVARIAHQVRTGLVQPSEVLAISFTNQAAEDLRHRLTSALPTAEESPLVTTFHGLGQRLLEEIEGRSAHIVDEASQLELIRQAAPDELSDAEISSLRDSISRAKQEYDPETALADTPELLEIFRRYQGLLEERGVVDLDDLVLRPTRLLAGDPERCARLADRFTSVSVDEYQDVNDVQAALVALLAPGGSSLCAIGDPKQAIYGFRGAKPGHFDRFGKAFPGTRTVNLSTSYRLTEEIAGAADALFEDRRSLRTTRRGQPVEIVPCATPEAEAEQILIRLERIVGGTSHFAVDSGRGGDAAEADDVGFGDVAVLCRTRAQRAEVLEALGRSGIPCRSVGEEEPHDPRSQKVAVMTMHAAKGREFEIVFLAGVEAGLLPLDLGELQADAEEERRLLYVALTRARRLAVVSWVRRRRIWGHRLPGRPSPFLARLPEDHVHRVDSGPPTPAPARQLRLF